MFAYARNEDCHSPHHYLKYLIGENMFKIVVTNFENCEGDGHPLHMLRYGRVVG